MRQSLSVNRNPLGSLEWAVFRLCVISGVVALRVALRVIGLLGILLRVLAGDRVAVRAVFKVPGNFDIPDVVSFVMIDAIDRRASCFLSTVL